ncbi:MAG: hypothetical protein U0625_04905 [Phycisphaerales bacterium]
MHSRISPRAALAAAASICLACMMALAPQAATDVGSKMVAARQANAALLKQYQWNCRTEIYMDNQLKDTRVEQLAYGVDGSLMRTELSNTTSHLPIGFLRRAIAQGQLQKIEHFMTGLRGLMQKYTEMTPPQIDAFMAKAAVTSVTAPDGTALMKLSATNVLEPGDSVDLWVDTAKHQWHKIVIATTFEKEKATVTASYKTNKAGLDYMTMAQIEVPSQKATLMMHNYDFQTTD